MNAAAYDSAAFADCFERLRYELAGRREDDRGVEFCRRQFARAAGPGCAEIQCELLRFGVSCSGESVDFALLVFRDLRDDVGGSAEAVKTEPFRFVCFDQASITDETGAEQRRGFRIAIKLWNRKQYRWSASVYSA